MHLEWNMSKYNLQEIIKHNTHKYKIRHKQLFTPIKERTRTQYRGFKAEMKNKGYTGMGGKNI